MRFLLGSGLQNSNLRRLSLRDNKFVEGCRKIEFCKPDPAAFDPAAFDPAAFDPAAFDPAAFDPAAFK
jgi:hypothetical protein